MIEKIERLIQEVIDLAARADADPREIHTKGTAAKHALWDEFVNMQLAINILDGMIPYKSVGLPWTIGWVNPSDIGSLA